MSRSDIVSVLGRFMYLQKKGAKYWACCPFHTEKTPSFVVNPEEQYYHCFGCGKSGSVITFLMEHENMQYTEAVETLAKWAGMQVPESESPEEAKRRALREKLLSATKLTAKYYYSCLKQKGEVAVQYLQKRRLSDETCVAFGLGYSPDRFGLKTFMESHGFAVETLELAGITDKSGGDRMESRLVIPIINAKGEVLGFGGRTLSADVKPKYLNTKGTPLFDKRKTLFGMNLFKKAQKAEKFDSLVLTEGYMDVISLHQAGIRNAIASMGTSLTEEQCKEIKKTANLVYVCFDGDAAGEMATWRSLDMLQSVGLDVKVMSLPEGMDPDDVCKSYGADGFRKLMSEAKPLTEFKIRQLAAKENMDTFAGREAFALKALPVLEALSPIGRDAHIQLVSELSNLSAESIKNSLQNFTVTRKTATKSGEEAHAEDEDKISKTELKNGRILLKLLLDGADYAKVSELDEECFKLPLHKRIFNYISEKNKAGLKLKTGELFALEPDSTEELEAIMSATDGYTIESAEKMYNAILSGIYKARKKSIMAELTAKIKLADGAEKQKLEEKLLKLINLRK